MRLCIFGGSFDPVHYGHLLMAETAREQLDLDRLLFMPTAIAPHKPRRPIASDKQRVEMLELALGGHESMSVSTREIERQGVSYTVETLRELAAEHRSAENLGAEVFFLLGADSLADLPTWREPAAVCELAILAVVRRAGYPEPDFGALKNVASPARLALFREHQVEMPLIELRSTDLRQRAAAGRSLRFRTPRAVEKYIEHHRLYAAP